MKFNSCLLLTAYNKKYSLGNTFDKRLIFGENRLRTFRDRGIAAVTDNLILADPKKQASWFEKVREAHQTETAEDYVELIADLIDANGEARIVDLASRFGVSQATVNKIVTRLKREGLVIAQPYRSLFLTEEGKVLAHACKARHLIIVDFLKSIGVSEKVAEMDAEGLEHHVSRETLKAFENVIKKLGKKS
ncbi:MAG: manganese-binding transcriptional regulator MntR [Alphaproteobacteria bacterium]|nr:manganese-binding transcriptional regulator MntR [Alphaproteobacteria bacterium]QQS56401.1 MAG: manganese-binding transcriptional regulator MntR [Alphaproteobacteria bacterium]